MFNDISSYLAAGSILAYGVAFLSGVVTSFTPCVYPLIPITMAYVSGRRKGKRGSFLLSLIYVLGMAVTYSALGMFAALTGKMFGGITVNPWVYLIVANIFILFSLHMMGVYTIKIPQIQIRGPGTQGGAIGAFFLGLTSGFVAAPCTAPVLGALLAYVATTQNVLFGGSLLFVFSLGLGTLLVLVGTFSGMLSSLPKSGAWMITVEKIFGLILLLVAEYFILQAGKLLI